MKSHNQSQLREKINKILQLEGFEMDKKWEEAQRGVQEYFWQHDQILALIEKQVKEERMSAIKNLKEKYAPYHNVLCEKKGEQFRKCLACVMEDELDTQEENNE